MRVKCKETMDCIQNVCFVNGRMQVPFMEGFLMYSVSVKKNVLTGQLQSDPGFMSSMLCNCPVCTMIEFFNFFVLFFPWMRWFKAERESVSQFIIFYFQLSHYVAVHLLLGVLVVDGE